MEDRGCLRFIMNTLQSLTKWQNTKKALGNTFTVGISDMMFYATIKWEQSI